VNSPVRASKPEIDGDGIGVEQREFERTLHIPLEQLVGQQENDAFVVALRIEPGDFRARRRRRLLRGHCVSNDIHWILPRATRWKNSPAN
jgi:hypothetical protein